MNIKIHKNEIEIIGISDFDLVKTLECGQCFRWNIEDYETSFKGVNDDDTCNQSQVSQKDEKSYIGVACGHAVRLRQYNKSIFITGSIKDFETIWRGYFDLDRDYIKIRKQLCIDDYMKKTTEYGAGIRILNQDKWEALCSFIISQNNNIPRIKTIIATLCRQFGEVIDFEDTQHFTFPSAAKLASLNAEQLAQLRCGYRADYIISAAKMVANGTIDLDALADGTPDETRKVLKKIHGVGDKVADCVMLFGLHMLDAFPLDVWMKRAVVMHYGPKFDPKIFSPYAGIAQQYIFHYSRTMGK